MTTKTIDCTRMTEREAAAAWLKAKSKADKVAIRERVVTRAKHKRAWKNLLAHIDAGNTEGVKAHAASGDERRKLMAALHPKTAKTAKPKPTKTAKPATNPADPGSILAAALEGMEPEQLVAFLVNTIAKRS